MAHAVIMPRQGQSVESCILTEWYKTEGELVSKGDLLFAYETDKAAFEEEAPEDGLLLARFFDEGDEVPVLQNVAVIGAEGDSAEEFRPKSSQSQAKNMEAVEDKTDVELEKLETEPAALISGVRGNGSASISPRARKLACVPVVPLTPRKGSSLRRKSRSCKSSMSSCSQRHARLPTVVSWAGW